MYCYERGDYQAGNEKDYQLEQQAFRLQAYLRALRGKLEREKASLAALRDETRTLFAQSSSSHLPDCPVARRRLLALQDLLYPPAAPPRQEPRREPVSQESYFSNHLVYNDAGDMAFKRTHHGEDITYQRGLILQKLAELDTLCKQEMMRINEVGTKLEPFKQLANDWNFQAELYKKYPKIDNVSKEKLIIDDNISMNKDNTMIQKCVNDIENIAFEEPINIALICQEYTNQENQAEEREDETREKDKESQPIEQESREEEKNEAKEAEEPSAGGEEAQRDEVDSGEGKRSEVAPISWRRLLVDKKKRKLESRRWTDCSSDGSSSSSSSHCAEQLGEQSFINKLMYSDSDYVYSPLFITESEDSD